jgi:hypothetical protein
MQKLHLKKNCELCNYRTSEIDKAKSRIRITINIGCILLLVFSAYYMVRRGKARVAGGENVQNTNLAKKKALREEKAAESA